MSLYNVTLTTLTSEQFGNVQRRIYDYDSPLKMLYVIDLSPFDIILNNATDEYVKSITNRVVTLDRIYNGTFFIVCLMTGSLYFYHAKKYLEYKRNVRKNIIESRPDNVIDFVLESENDDFNFTMTNIIMGGISALCAGIGIRAFMGMTLLSLGLRLFPNDSSGNYC